MALTEITAGKVYYALDTDLPLPTAGISDGSLAVINYSATNEFKEELSFFNGAWQSRVYPYATLSDGRKGELVVLSNPAGVAQAHNRYITGVAETRLLLGHMTWTEEEKVTAIRFKLTPNAAGTQAAGDSMRIVFDTTPVDDTSDDAQAWSYLQAATTAEDLDVEYTVLTYIPKANLTDADAAWSRWFEFALPLRRADFLYVEGNDATSDMNILAEVG